jgi:beta-mannanase
MENVRTYGAIPVYSWSSASSSSEGEDPAFKLSTIVAGAYDSYIREFAEAARDWGHPFFLRFDWEMNGNWFPWGEGIGGNRPGRFVAAWRHVHDIFTAVGATNATWVWCPYADTKHKFAPIRRYYPGNAYVDWTCLDGYNWGKNAVNSQRWRSFAQIFSSSYREVVRRIAPHKPMMLAELASGGGGHAKAAWVRGMFRALATKFRRVRGLVWFDQVDRGVQWPLETSPPAARAFAQGLHRHPFRPNLFGAISNMPIRPPR